MIDLDFDTVEAAEAFRDFLETVVWSVPDSAPALVGTPKSTILELMPEQPPRTAAASYSQPAF